MVQRKGRTGRYIKQPNGFSAFVPARLLPGPMIQIDDELYQLLSQADRAIGRLDGAIQILPNADLFVFMYIRKEAVLSSQIEGTQSSLADVLEAEAKITNPSRPNDVAEVINYVSAMNYGLSRLETLPLSVRLIKEIHKKVLHGVRGANRQPGQLRQSQNWLGPEGCTISNATYVPPPVHELDDLLGDLEKFLHSKSTLPALLQIGLAHSQFESTHPFLDGNGRVGRLLVTFLLCEREILRSPVLYLSHYFKRHRQEYYDHLQATRDAGDWEGWLKFFVRGVAEVSDEAAKTAREIVELREEYRSLMMSGLSASASTAVRLLESLFLRPYLTVGEVQKLLDVSYPTANNLVAEFERLGILLEYTGQSRNRRFRFEPYIKIFR